jgi:small-conductance mechanosensitive channel
MTAKGFSGHRGLILTVFSMFTIVVSVTLMGFNLPIADASAQAVLATQKSKDKKASAEGVQLPEQIDSQNIDAYMATLSDEQVRRLLIEALKKQAAEENAAAKPEEDIGLVAGFIQRSNELLEKLKERIAFLQSGATATPANVPSIFTYLGTGEKATSLTSTIGSVVAVFAAAFAIVLLFHLLTARTRQRLENNTANKFSSRLGASIGIALLHIVSMVLFTGTILTLFYTLLDRTTGQRVLVATYIVAVLSVWAVSVISRFLLAPKRGKLRFLPIADENAIYIYRWIIAIAAVLSFGGLTCGIIRLAGASEAAHFKSLLMVGIVAAGMLIWMIAGKRNEVAAALLIDIPEKSMRATLARNWHYLAISGVIFLLLTTTIQDLVQERQNFLGTKTLLMIPFYLLLDWGLRQILDVSFGLAQKPDDLKGAIRNIERIEYEDTLERSDIEISTSGHSDRATKSSYEAEPSADKNQEDVPAAEDKEEKKEELSSLVNLQRMQHVIRVGLRGALAAWMLIWLFSMWGINLPIGEKVAEAAFNILVVVIIGYVAWEVTSAAIQKRLKQEMPDDDEEREEGGAGGSRIGTLLLILRKFLLVVIIIMVTLITLSSIGVDIAPLIAGAGVIGLAIGFGAQTLVKDIISGVFFLVDDAIRVGDYVNVGSQKGTVEHISLRSLRLRHPRGMVYTIPFSDINSVTNFSRDYIITKLDFRVPFETDVEKVRKLVKKKVYKKILANEKLAPKLMGKLKSQGVRELDDSAMIVRVKYKTPPGEQFAIRKEVYRLMQEAFQEAGLKFAHRNVTVALPPEVQQSLASANSETKESVIKSAAAAAGAAIQTQEEQAAAKGKASS